MKNLTLEVADSRNIVNELAGPFEVNGVHIGQTFYTKIGCSKIKSQVVDFIKTYSMTTGEVISIKILAKVYGFSSENTWETTFEDVLKNMK